MHLPDTRIEILRNDDRTKIVLPVKRNWAALAVYSVLVVVWVAMLAIFVYSVFVPPTPLRDPAISTGYRIGWRLLLIVWLVFWVRLIGRHLFHWWQFHLADREILFIENNVFIMRRPVSIFGVTTAYAMQHMRPFYINDRYRCLAFQYGGVQHHLLGTGLTEAEGDILRHYLNDRFFPNWDADDEE